MSQYTRLFLHFLHAVTDARKRVHTFLFGTRLTNVTRSLKQKDPDEALAAVTASVDDWSGGTRIATSLHAFNKLWARRVLTQGAIVLLITDGLERDGGEELEFEIDRLHRSCRRLIWLNPLLRFSGFEAKARGIRSMLPHVDELRPDSQSGVHGGAGPRAVDPTAGGPGIRRNGWSRQHKLRREQAMATLATEDDILKAAEDWRKEGRGVALATVVETWGSAPRPVGSNLVIDSEGNFLGSVSGGCVEGAVVTEAIDVIESGKPKTIEFGVADETAWKVGLSCGGTIRVYVEKVDVGVKLDILKSLNAERNARRAAVVVTDVDSGEQRLVKAADVARDPLKDLLEKHIRSGKSGMEETPQGKFFLTVHVPPPRIVDHRRGPYQPGAGADGEAARLRRHHRRSAHRVCHPGAFPGREGDRGMAGHRAAAARRRSLHGVRRAHA